MGSAIRLLVMFRVAVWVITVIFSREHSDREHFDAVFPKERE